MKKNLLFLAAAAAFSFSSCSENTPAETAETTDGMTTAPAVSTSTSMDYSPDAINSRADRMANDMATKMKFDDATRTRVRDIYATRGQRMAELNQKYTADTMGMAAARRDVYNTTDTEMKTVFTDPTQYSAYESSRMDYMDDRYMDNSTMNTSDNMSADSRMMDDEGGKMKVKADGDIKMKDAEGNKAKMDADDGTIKMKLADGEKTVIK